MPTPDQKKALEAGLLTKKQYDKLPSALLDGIIKSKRKKGVSGAPKKKGGGKPKYADPNKKLPTKPAPKQTPRPKKVAPKKGGKKGTKNNM